jgi:Protein of unknown function (DUF2591)
MDKELEGVALDEAVARAIGDEPGADYSTSWHHAGRLIERERISLLPVSYGKTKEWEACVNGRQTYDGWEGEHESTGPTALIAAMRCFVRSKTPNVLAQRRP